MSVAVPDDIRRFVRTHIRSMLQLEALLLLARDPDRWWNADAVYRELRSSLEASLEQLEHLAGTGLLEAKQEGERQFRFGRTRLVNTAIVEKLLELRASRFHVLIELIYARDARERAQEFADAFKLKKPEVDDG